MSTSKPASVSFPFISYQPISLFYRIARLVTIFVRLPYWLLRAGVPALRPDKTWSFKQAIMRTVLQHFIDVDSSIGITPPISVEPGKQKSRWAAVEPFPETKYVGPLISSTVKPATAGGTWYGVSAAPDPATARSWTKVAMHIHGGGFVLFDGRDDATAYLARTYKEKANFDAVFAPQYRLAGYGGRDPFPAALQDALTSYLYLVETLGISPDAITISGDSAGGNLAIALLRYLERFGAQISVPKPGRAVFLSPWVKPSAALHESYDSWELSGSDVLPASLLRWGARAYLSQSQADHLPGSGRNPGENEWVDSLGHPFTTNVPVFLNYGDREIFSVDCAAWAEEMRKAADSAWTFVVNVERGAPHDTPLLGEQLGFDSSAEEVAQAVAKFVEDNKSRDVYA